MRGGNSLSIELGKSVSKPSIVCIDQDENGMCVWGGGVSSHASNERVFHGQRAELRTPHTHNLSCLTKDHEQT